MSRLESPSNGGHAADCNRGLAAASGDPLVLLNQDVVLDPDWLDRVVQAFDADPAVGVVGTKLVYPDLRTIQHGGGWLEVPQGHGRHFGHREIDDGRCDGDREVEWVTGAAFALRRSTYLALGGLDTGFYPGYFDDVDGCLRARAAGWRVLYLGSARGVHLESAAGIPPEALHRFYERARLRCSLKHLGAARWLAEFLPVEAALPYARSAYLDLALDAPAVLAQRGDSPPEATAAVVAACLRLADLGAEPAGPSERAWTLIRELRDRIDQLALRSAMPRSVAPGAPGRGDAV
jgi:GT2 family glycosyltransferase